MAKKLVKRKYKQKSIGEDQEFVAMRNVYEALKPLSGPAQNRVLDYVFRRLALSREIGADAIDPQTKSASAPDNTNPSLRDESAVQPMEKVDGLEGISPVAQKWIRRHSLDVNKLSSLFSLGVDEIDLVANKVPGKNKKQRLLNVLRLLGIASYLGTGAPRVSYVKLKEASTHYDSHDEANFAANMRAVTSEISGSREAGYTLTARGLTAATELVKEMVEGKSS